MLIQEHMTEARAEAGVTAHDAAWIKGRQTERKSDSLEAQGDFLSFCAAVKP